MNRQGKDMTSRTQQGQDIAQKFVEALALAAFGAFWILALDWAWRVGQ